MQACHNIRKLNLSLKKLAFVDDQNALLLSLTLAPQTNPHVHSHPHKPYFNNPYTACWLKHTSTSFGYSNSTLGLIQQIILLQRLIQVNELGDRDWGMQGNLWVWVLMSDLCGVFFLSFNMTYDIWMYIDTRFDWAWQHWSTYHYMFTYAIHCTYAVNCLFVGILYFSPIWVWASSSGFRILLQIVRLHLESDKDDHEIGRLTSNKLCAIQFLD